jgi:hypothetical protein
LTYDAEPASCGGTSFEIGRLGAITRGGEAVEYCYRFGRTTRDGERTYLYDPNGNRSGLGYPGGVTAAYGFDFADREVNRGAGRAVELTGRDVRETVVFCRNC